MFRKMFCGIALLCAAAMVSCAAETESSGDVPVAADTAVTTEDTTEETAAPTDRPRDIVSIEDFDYEMIDGHVVITNYTGKNSEVIVPAEIEGAPVTEIGYYAFEAKYGVSSIVLPESVEVIGQFAFMDCADLISVNIPEKVAGIERGTFASCTSLTELVLPKKTAYIREEAFTACEALTSLTINDPDIEYENWGLEELPDLTILAPEGSAVCKWAEEKGFTVSAF